MMNEPCVPPLQGSEIHNNAQAADRSIRSNRLSGCLIGFASILLFLFVAFRALSVPFTHDESFSYLDFVEPHSFKEIITHPVYSSGNHLLNTFAMKVVTLVLHPDDWTLRLPSLFAYALFLYAGFRICRHLFKPRYQLAVFVLLNLNIFLLQFFSLARGYAPALGLMMASLWLFFQSLDSDINRPFLQASAVGAAALACFANITFLNFYCALLLVWFVIRIRNLKRAEPKPKFLKLCIGCVMACWDMILATAILAGTLIRFAVKLRETDQFYYGGNKGFIADTVISLINACLYGHPFPERLLPVVGRWILVIVALHFVFYAAVTFFAKRNVHATKASFLYWIMFVSAIAIVIQHYALGTRYPFDRAAILFVPMFVLSIAWLFAWDGRQYRILMQIKTGILLLAALGIMAWQFSRVANVSYAIPWKFDSKTTAMLNDLEIAKAADQKPGVIRLGLTWPLQPSVAFYTKVRGLDWIEKVDRGGIRNRAFDYYYIQPEDLEYATSTKALILKHYGTSSTWLMRAAPQQ